MNRRCKRALHLAAACVVLAGLPRFALADGSVVNVTMWDMGATADMSMDRGIGMPHAGMMGGTMGIKLSEDTVPAGEVTFKVTNNSTDQVHEMLVVPMPPDGKGLPYSENDARFDEDAAASLGEVEELDPGKTGELTLPLKPGRYALACNVANHYADGMWTVLTVK